jgi:hypothetical protein
MATASVDCTKRLHDEIEQTPEEFRPLLLRIVHSFREGVSVLPSAQTSFQEGWKDVMAGNTQSVDTLWDGIDTD